MSLPEPLEARLAALRQRADIRAVVGRHVKLGRGSKPRGKCPFHGSKSDSFAVDAERQRARCWGCGWSGDAIEFIRDMFGLDFKGALERLEADFGLSSGPGSAGLNAAPVWREKQAFAPREVDMVPSAEVARHLWSSGVAAPDKLRVWLRARHVPEAMLGDHWLAGLRFCDSAPVSAWQVGRGPDSVAHAPAMLAPIRMLVTPEDGGAPVLRLIGVHATFLSPGLTAKRRQLRRDGSVAPARKMFGGSAMGFVLFGQYHPEATLYVAEGIETLLSGMALLGVGAPGSRNGRAADVSGAGGPRPEVDAITPCGIAVLSLGNLQGEAALRSIGKARQVLPLWSIRSDPMRKAVCFAHRGPVIGLIDADMKPLAGPIDRETGKPRGLAIQERPGGPVVHRALSTGERAEICAQLFVEHWRKVGCAKVRAMRPRMGRDFNDAAGEMAA